MDGSELKQMKADLLSRREVLGVLIHRGDGEATDPTGDQAEIIDMAQASEQLDRDKSLVEQEHKELEAIDRALEKMATAGYGICEDCDEEILSKRLLVLPEARLCAHCQAFEEKRQVRGSRHGVANYAVR